MSKKKTVSEDVIKRFRALVEEEQREAFQAGKAAGEAWVNGGVKPKQLKKLAKAIEENRGVASYVEQDPNAHLSAAQRFVEDIGADEEFWESVLDDATQADDTDFLRGFVEGALDTWYAVEAQL